MTISAAEWQALQAGDAAAFKRVYAQHVGLVHYVALRTGLGAAEAEDVVQETFTRLFQRAGEVRGPEKVKSWLAVCARNLAVDRLRAQRRFAKDGDAEAAGSSEGLWGGGSAAALRELELKLVGELLEQVARTPGGETLRQFYAEGLSAKEIARRNGEAVSTVTTRLSRLRAKFRDEFRRHVEDLRDRQTPGGDE